MSKIIEALWRLGVTERLDEGEGDCSSDCYLELRRAFDELDGVLTPEQRKIFEKYELCRERLDIYKETCAFKKGVSFAVKLGLEALEKK